jgi:hypothetical protein
MKFNLLALACALALAFGLSMGSFAGSIDDADSDGIPDTYDNCVNAANGPTAGSCATNQDGDEDGYGNSCDSDFNNDGLTGFDDLNATLAAVGGPDAQIDLNCDGLVGFDDLNAVLASIGNAPGASGLACSAPNLKFTCPPL